MNHFEIIEKFIKEEGQKKGSVSGAMALQSLQIIQYGTQNTEMKGGYGNKCYECNDTGHVVSGFAAHSKDNPRRFTLEVTHCSRCNVEMEFPEVSEEKEVIHHQYLHPLSHGDKVSRFGRKADITCELCLRAFDTTRPRSRCVRCGNDFDYHLTEEGLVKCDGFKACTA